MPDWATPQALFDALHAEFDFTLDVCATPDNAQRPAFFTPAADGLAQPWSGRCWVNPPYGPGIVRWLTKALFNLALGEAELAVFLLPARTDTRWWHNLVLPYAAEIRFLRGRLRFTRAGARGTAPFPSVLIIYRAPLPALAPLQAPLPEAA